jgi:type I restriction enzyme S subunit
VIEQAERVKRGLMEELLTGGLGSEAIERGEVPEGWALSSVSSVLKPSLFIDGDWVESKDQSPDGDVRLIQLADIGDGHFIDKSDRHLTKDAAVRLKCTFLIKGDLLVARMPEPLGRCCVFPLDGEERFVTVVDVAVMRPHESFNAMWLMNLINSDYARRFIEDNAGGTTRKRISRKNLGGLLLPVPPISEQCRIAEILSDSDNFIAKQKKTVEQLTRTKRGLMDDLLTGKVRTV